MRSSDRTLDLPPSGAASHSLDAAGLHLATLVMVGDDGTPHVQLAPDEPVHPVRLAVSVSRERLVRAAAIRQQVVVLVPGDQAVPVLLGLIETAAAGAETSEGGPDTSPGTVVEADVDGRRVRVTARDEIVLQCGQASITLRRNGRVVVRGTYVETYSEGTNRIKGGQVLIN